MSTDRFFKDEHSAAQGLAEIRAGKTPYGDDPPEPLQPPYKDKETGVTEYDEPRFKSERDAFEELTREAIEARDFEKEEREAQEAEQRKQEREEIEATRKWSNDDALQFASLKARERGLQGGKEIYNRALAELPELERSDPRAAAERRAQLAEFAERLQEEERNLLHAGSIVRHVAESKDYVSGQKELERACPALKSEKAREELVAWAVDNGHCTETEARSITDVGTVARAWRQMMDERKQASRAAARRKVAASSVSMAGPGSSKSSAEARERLKETGSFFDALNTIHLSRLERRHGIS